MQRELVRAGTSGEREHGGATDEPERFASDDGAKVPAHDRLESSAAGGPKRVGSTIRGEWSEREMGLGYHVRVDGGRLVVPGGGGGFVHAEGGGLVSGRAADERVGERGLADGDRRQLPTVDILVHSDRGSQYASGSYQRLLASRGIRCSMSRKGNCWDNAPMESFFATLKKELVHQERYATRRKRGRACSSTSRCFTTGCGGIRRSATRVRRGSRKRLDAPSDLTHKGNPPAAERHCLRNNPSPAPTKTGEVQSPS